ncbi:MAG: hypothetical protein KF819_05310 [Labilithrix sp.]|nr:hypothetical protein [Labilithrix sp.]
MPKNELALANYRRRKRWDALTAAEKKTLVSIEAELSTAEEEEGEDSLELVDVIDSESEKKAYLFVLWPFGSGALVDLKKKEIVADVAQHHFDARGDGELRAALAAAWARQHAALGIREKVSFEADKDEDAKKPAQQTTKKKSGALERIEAMRAAIRGGAAADQKELWALVSEAIDFKVRRPLPARRLFELDETTRAALELIHEGYDASDSMLGSVGLPSSQPRACRDDPAKDPGDLARFLGHAPLGPLDVPVQLEGNAHPAWCLVSDAVHGLRPNEEVVSALATLSSESKVALLRALMLPLASGHLSGAWAPPPAGAQPGSPSARGAHNQRHIRFVNAFAASLGEDGVRVAQERLAARAGWLEQWLPQLTRSPGMIVPHWFEQTLALGVLARAAKNAGSALDPGHDALLSALARYLDATYPLRVVLEDLPKERAAKIALADLHLIEHFPSAESATAAIERLEASGGGPYVNALFERVVTAIGAPMGPALEAAIERGSPQKKVLAKHLPKSTKKKRA